MDREFKIALGLFATLLLVSTLLLEVLARIHFWTPEFLRGFLPFVLLLAPYILFSSSYFCEKVRASASGSFLRRLVLPAGILLSYLIASVWAGTFQKFLLFKLALWVFAPLVLLVSRPLKDHPLYPKEILAALILWFPIEFGALSGFDIIFSEGIQIPALAFAAPVLGLYLFAIVRGLPDIGYNFRWKASDMKPVAVSLLALACLLIFFGVYSGFIHFSEVKTSAADCVKLILGIYFLNALPEELLFRGIIQNLLDKILGRFSGGKWIALALAAVIFGYSHYNNNNPPDMRYVYLAAIAGLFYGWTYMKTGKTTVSALVHTGVNFLWAIFFSGTGG